MTDCLADGGAGASVSVVRRLRVALLAMVAALVVASCPSVAGAAQTHQLTFSVSNAFGDPEGIAVDDTGGPTNGHIWVADGNGAGCCGSKLQIIDQSGAGLLSAGSCAYDAVCVADSGRG